MRKLTLALLLLALLLAFVVVPAFAIVDKITPADDCRGAGGVGSQAAGSLLATGQISGFPVPNNNPGNANVTENAPPPDACLP